MKQVGFVVALPDEMKTLAARLPQRGAWLRRHDGSMAALSGAGPESAKRAAGMLVKDGARLLISWGCAAALDPVLAPGHLLLPAEVLTADGRIYKPDVEIRRTFARRLSAQLPVGDGKLVESLGLVATPQAKRELFQRTAGAAIDMESAAVAKVAADHSLPFLAVRAIADPAEMGLPKAVAAALGDGEIDLFLLLGHLLRHPSEIPELVRLGLQFRAAQRSLRLAASLLDGAFPDPLEFSTYCEKPSA